MSAYSKRMYQYREDIKVRLWDRLHSLILSFYTHENLHLSMEDIWNDNKFVRLSRIDKSWLRGWFEATYRQQVWHLRLEWRVFNSGKWCSDADTRATGFDWSKCDSEMGAHFWKGTEFLYTIPKPFYAAIGWSGSGLCPDVPKRLHSDECLRIIATKRVA